MSLKLNEKNDFNNNNLFEIYKNPLKNYNNNSINLDKKITKSSDFKSNYNNNNNNLISPNNSFISSIITSKDFFFNENLNKKNFLQKEISNTNEKIN